jgi:hypothetical protein
MRHWFDEHGQSSGGHRKRHYQIKPPVVSPDEFDVVRSPARYEPEVFKRDSYTCCYCGLKLLSKEVLIAFEQAVGGAGFRTQGTNKQQHGVIHAFKIVADHVVPYRRGGRTHPDNLVSACPGCNYGKDAHTVEQMGVDDPFDHLPVDSGWDGLTSLIPGLRHHVLIPGSCAP